MTQLSEKDKATMLNELRSSLQVNVPPGLGRKMLLNWTEVREMSKNGISFGAHTVNHPILTNLSTEQARDEIIQSRKSIEEQIDRKVTSFAYPNGHCNAELIQLVKDSGFSCAVCLMPRKLISAKDCPYNLPRMSMLDFGKFKVMFSGLWGDLAGVRAAIESGDGR